MSGHSKWANIKHKKEVNDKVKGQVFAKLSRLITLAVIEGGLMPDPTNNFKLRFLIEKAKTANMPKDNIERAIERGYGPNKSQLKECVYEAFGPFGVAMIITASSDNPTRTVNAIKSGLEQYQAKLGAQGSVMYLFKKVGVIVFDKITYKEDDIFEFAQKCNALDIENNEASYIIYIPFIELGRVKDHIGSLVSTSIDIEYIPDSHIILPEEQLRKIATIINSLETLDDIHEVFTNIKIAT
ncbi:YebC/PmpR family DNA-binding transcriptional regulator [Candidatus Roizmanbacteria bacterium CG_4_10_14_0_8_um_filter_33_9]|uniref:Probable transcriptional regulatory protein COY87_03535 n=1 Tax=Candidatus Roizmanbacteria bacterium CG_4_10_14_0_8_um_filter_33_9 TaxID=1974826 RepID=A0A2M7QHZ4_9BACT|nr:MAG: YebC/PmpR family DNA-binding transcriptional regulator [Candidatus Roizmanbacteria bacterium CG_4_10_14_0_8_um_filter_33_9]